MYILISRSRLHWIFSSLLIDTPDFHRFPTVHMVGKFVNFRAISDVLEKFQMYWLFISASKYISYRPPLKNLVRIYWKLENRPNLLKFLQSWKHILGKTMGMKLDTTFPIHDSKWDTIYFKVKMQRRVKLRFFSLCFNSDFFELR